MTTVLLEIEKGCQEWALTTGILGLKTEQLLYHCKFNFFAEK